jgi:hypothetical protein
MSNPQRAQSSHESHKLHGTDADPWAISDHGIVGARHRGETEGMVTLEGQKRLPESLAEYLETQEALLEANM